MLLNATCEPLSRAEFLRLLALAQAGDVKARNRIVSSSIKLALRQAHYWSERYGGVVSPEELVSVAAIGCSDKQAGGLTRAVERFDASRGLQWSTYATLWIDDAIRRYLRREHTHASATRPEIEEFDFSDPGDALDYKREMTSLLAYAGTELPTNQRVVIEARLTGGSYETAGKAIGRSKASAQKLERQAIARLRDLVHGKA